MVKSYLPKNVVFSSYMHMYNAACVFHYIKVYFLFSQFKVRCALDVKVRSRHTPLKVSIVGLVFIVHAVLIFEIVLIFWLSAFLKLSSFLRSSSPLIWSYFFQIVFIFWVIFIFGLVFLVKVVFIFKTVFFLVIFTFEMSAYWFVLTMLTHGWVNKSGKNWQSTIGQPGQCENQITLTTWIQTFETKMKSKVFSKFITCLCVRYVRPLGKNKLSWECHTRRHKLSLIDNSTCVKYQLGGGHRT